MGKSSKPTKTKKKSYKGPFPMNKTFTYQTVRRNMEMSTDGPTVNEVTPLDTTQSFSSNDGQDPQNVGGRPVKTGVVVQKWLGENIKGIVLTVIATLFAGFCVRIAITHTEQLTSHQKDIEHIEKSISEQGTKIDHLQEKTNEINTNLLLLEQRLNLEKESTNQGKKVNKK